MIVPNLEDALILLQPLGLFTICVALYSIFIFKFYKFLAKKSLFELDLHKYNTSEHPFFKKLVHILLYLLKYAILFPIFSFFWFSVLVVLLAFLSKTATLDTILLTSMALISAVRITAYYDEDLSKDLSKMLPFALLGVFLVDIAFFSVSSSVGLLLGITEKYDSLIYYLVFIVLLEFFLNISSIISGLLSSDESDN